LKAKVNPNKCIGCLVCADYCPVDAIRLSNKTGKAFIKSDKCTGCGECVEECPVKAIKLKNRK